ncbi:RnfABCDGE type electron transport complex subunit G [Vibrio sp. JC009]|uniref:RnfABCDGE type electron transport complex subunit G n=1 Tax=Vibrio sp. JC009 TaxID=2912314 RepID=UPI0023B0B2A7|nr:RnfABCDGE type electron transport complex subunit G [Vibrio sp. JC009]WED24107.1 RnfABCDGE type electron transport complex subunit G [Vibrio sp. JC009]
MQASIEKWKENIPYQSALLAVCSGVAAMLLVVVQYYTSPVIEQRIAEDQNALLSEVLNGKPFANAVFESEKEVEYGGLKYQIYPVMNEAGELTHYVIRGGEEGYSGEIRFLAGVDTLGRIEGVRILSHTETPGLGDKIELAKSDWVLSFTGRSLQNTPVWGVKKDGGDFDQFSGATITPRSVVRGVHKAMLALEKSKESGDE